MLILAVPGCRSKQQSPVDDPGQVVGLSTSLPLIWGESGDVRGQLAGRGQPHWAIALLARRGRIVPLDTLSGPHGALPLPAEALLVLAQPLPLMPEENVALDTWVRAGGRLLLFVDPMLTAESNFAVGDSRGPQRVAMLSPILRHWNLELEFDPAQPAGERQVEFRGVPLPVDLPGRFAVPGTNRCRLEAADVIAECRIGKGQVLAVADAAVLDGDDAGRTAAMSALLAFLDG